MGFLKSAFSVVSAPVTVPLKVGGNVIREVGEAVGAEPVSKPLSTLAGAGYSVAQKGESVSSVLPSVAKSVRELQPLAAAASGDPGAAMSLISNFQGVTPGELAGRGAPQMPFNEPVSGIAIPPGPGQGTILIIMGAVLLAALILRR